MGFYNFVVLLALFVIGPVAVSAQEKVKIMALGDSITGSPGCWRALLWRDLQDADVTNTDFVGTLPGQGCGFAYDGENEGHGGFLATNIARQNQLVGWLEKTTPDIVMMHLGTNDIWNNRSPSEILSSFDTLVSQMRSSNPAMKILVAQIIPMRPSNCRDCGARVENLNKAIAEWAPQLSTTESPITVVDCWTGFNTATMTGDGVHPNNAGNEAMAACWLDPLIEAIQGEWSER